MPSFLMELVLLQGHCCPHCPLLATSCAGTRHQKVYYGCHQKTRYPRTCLCTEPLSPDAGHLHIQGSCAQDRRAVCTVAWRHPSCCTSGTLRPKLSSLSNTRGQTSGGLGWVLCEPTSGIITMFLK